MTAEPMPNDKITTALKAAAGVLEAIRPYCLLELSTKYTVSHDGHRLGAFTIDEAQEQLQQKWEPVLRPELRENNGTERVGEPRFAGHALDLADAALPRESRR